MLPDTARKTPATASTPPRPARILRGRVSTTFPSGTGLRAVPAIQVVGWSDEAQEAGNESLARCSSTDLVSRLVYPGKFSFTSRK